MPKNSSARTIAGVLVGLVGVMGAASVLLTTRKAGTTATTGTPTSTPSPASIGGPSLTVDNRVVNVGLASGIPQAAGYDSGPVDFTYNAPGWEYAPLGVR